MPTDPRQWDAVASVKLARIFGERDGRALHATVLAELGLERVGSPDDLHRFAQHLSTRGTFERAVGGMLSLHATMYGDGAQAAHR